VAGAIAAANIIDGGREGGAGKAPGGELEGAVDADAGKPASSGRVSRYHPTINPAATTHPARMLPRDP
jgi:hypothetical protein